MLFVGFRKAHRFGVAKLLRQRFHLRYQGIAAHIRARDKIFRVLVSYQAAVVVHQEYGAFSHAGFLQAAQNGIQGNHCGQHPREILVHVFQGHCYHKGRPVSRRHGQRIAAELDYLQLLGLQAGNKGPVQRFRDEGVLLGPKISLRCACAFSGFTHCRQVNERAAIGLYKVF